jgi:hypothetical protein
MSCSAWLPFPSSHGWMMDEEGWMKSSYQGDGAVASSLKVE